VVTAGGASEQPKCNKPARHMYIAHSHLTRSTYIAHFRHKSHTKSSSGATTILQKRKFMPVLYRRVFAGGLKSTGFSSIKTSLPVYLFKHAPILPFSKLIAR